MQDISRTFPSVLDLQCGGGHFAKALAAHAKEGGNWSPGIEQLVVADGCPAALSRGLQVTRSLTAGTAAAPSLASSQYTDVDAEEMGSLDFDDEPGSDNVDLQAAAGGAAAPPHPLQDTTLVPVVCSEEYLPFKPETFDLIIANLNLQWTNDLPGALKQLRAALKPDGLLLAAMVGGETLHELQVSSAMADFDRRGGPLPHVSPMTRMSDVGGLLQGAGFALPTVDTEEVQVGYGTAAVLMEHLQGSGDSAAGSKARVTPRIDTMLASAAAYHVMHSEEPWSSVQQQLESASPQQAEAVDTSVVATLHIIYASGWAPHETQQKPKARGTAKKHFGDFAEAPTTATPDKAEGR